MSRFIGGGVPMKENTLGEFNRLKKMILASGNCMKEFIKKHNEFTVNMVLIYKDTPRLRMVYPPSFDEIYSAKQDKGAFQNNGMVSIVRLTKSFHEFL